MMPLEFSMGFFLGIIIGYSATSIILIGWLARIETKIDKCMMVIEREPELREAEMPIQPPHSIRKTRTMWD